MSILSKASNWILLTIIAFAVACHKKDPAPDCGCEGRTVKRVENVRASLAGSGFFTIFKEDGKTYSAYVSACKSDSTWEKSLDFKVPDYIISGNIKLSCFTGPTIMIQSAPIEITAIRKD